MKKSYRRKIREAGTAKCRRMAQVSNHVQAAARLTREPDFETLRRRAITDSRGLILRHGTTYKGTGAVLQWEIRRTIAGRHEQFDLVANGGVLRTVNRRHIPADLRPH